jgi:hypothetical protein
MSVGFADIPEDAKRLYVDYSVRYNLDTAYMQVLAELPKENIGNLVYSKCLWEGRQVIDDSDWLDKDELKSLKEELQVACDYYGITVNLESDDYWDWEGERIL